MKEQDVSEVTCDENVKLHHVQEQLSKGHILDVITLFKALSDETRMKIAYALTIEPELCVYDVAQIVGATTATASHHLRRLRSLGLAKYRKEGKLVYYSLDDDHVKQLMQIAFEHASEVSKR